jgi:L-ascorbate metabolism protein UlaG (beta-lactamase superfamily)
VEVEPHRDYELGPFTVRFVPSAHSKLLLGMAVPYSGELTCEHLDALHPGAYACGQVWGIRIEVAGIALYHQGSANLIDEEVPEDRVDVFLAGVAGRSFTERYWERILPRLDPAAVVPTHYDDFFVPLDQDLDLIGNARVSDVPDEVAAVSRDAAVAALPRLTPLRG